MSDAAQFFGQSLWYAWGRMDSGEYKGQDLKLDAFEFAALVRERREEFAAEKTHYFQSIQEQWTLYVKSKRKESQE